MNIQQLTLSILPLKWIHFAIHSNTFSKVYSPFNHQSYKILIFISFMLHQFNYKSDALILTLLHCRSIAFITFETNISILWQNFLVQFRKSKLINLGKDLNGSVLSLNHWIKIQFSSIICLNCTSPHIHRNKMKARFMTFSCHVTSNSPWWVSRIHKAGGSYCLPAI